MKTPNITYTVNHDLCTGCGICEGMCPSTAISFIVTEGTFRPVVNNSLCKNENGCHRCFDSCPGVGIDLKSELFKNAEHKDDKYVGPYLESYVGYSLDTEIRYHSASGGMITQFLVWLLDKKYIDGAVVTKFDKKSPLKVKSFIATTREEILQAKSSKYSPVVLNDAVIELKKAQGTRYIVVGLPCHIQGFRKAESLDKRLRNKIVGHFAIYCSSSRTFKFTDYVLRERGINIKNVNYLSYRDRGNQGGLVASGIDDNGHAFDYYQDYRKYCHPLRSIFVPRRCLLCIDHYGELSDISFGDINVKPYNEDKIGINSIIVRNLSWNKLLKECMEDNIIYLDKVDINIINKSQPSARMKKLRNAGFVTLLKKLGKKVPIYNEDYKGHLTLKVVILYYINRFQQFIGRNENLWFVIKFIKKNKI